MESTYQQCLAHELSLNGIAYQLEYPLPVNYKGVHLDCGYRVDVYVENSIILELKAVETLTNVHVAQLMTYMKLAEVKQGFLLNFNVKLMKNGIKSYVL